MSKPVHSASATVQINDLTRAGSSIEMEVKHKGSVLGYLSIGRGAIWWKAKSKQTYKRLSWSKFADLMNTHFEIEV